MNARKSIGDLRLRPQTWEARALSMNLPCQPSIECVTRLECCIWYHRSRYHAGDLRISVLCHRRSSIMVSILHDAKKSSLLCWIGGVSADSVEVWSSTRVSGRSSQFHLLHRRRWGGHFRFSSTTSSVRRWHAIAGQTFATTLGFLSARVGRLYLSHPGLVSGTKTATQSGQDRINLVRLETSSAEDSTRKVIHPGMWRPGQSGQLCQESRCPARQPARHEVSYKQYRVGWQWLLSSSTSSTATADPESRSSSKASISPDLVEDWLL